ncbi:phosphoenolpyruvate--protein phosphotransferase [Oryzibacter oryziterrae]|uniref:phosphoenolpyruvate--protein phosphotransferase n=1 Tax=Oryzibacter oryziterrae TaxID=2766474 RepID=UPI001F019F9E|nr:phosphoenolpyruvate--protein phosphotransferase [Oryzibacter oryziterrae]
MSSLYVFSPLSGRALPLAASPDPVFAGGMVGDGLAIDPDVGELRSPCTGTVIATHASGHAVTVRADEGPEVLMHVGVDTVTLAGAGFTAHVAEGQRVTKGDLLVSFDIAAVRPKVPSLISMVIITNGDAFKILAATTSGTLSFGDAALTLVSTGTAAAGADDVSDSVSLSVALRIPHGLHARPAAQLANAAKTHGGSVTVSAHGKSVNGKSVVALMSLGTRFGDTLDVRVDGAGAEAAADMLLDLIVGGLGDTISDGPGDELASETPSPASAPLPSPLGEPFVPGANAVIRGRSAVAGVALGPIVRHGRAEVELPPNGQGIEVERQRLRNALTVVAARIGDGASGARAGVAEAHREILDDPELAETAEADIAAGRSAEWAWAKACARQAEVLAGLADARLAERAADMRDVSAQVIAVLTGKENTATLASLPAGSVVLADEILPSETAGLVAGHLAAILMRDGGPTSHAAIIAAGLGIPTIVALGPEADRIPDGAEVIVDAGLGNVTVFPTEGEVDAVRGRIAERVERKAAQRAAASSECRLSDGKRIEVFGNLGRVGEGKGAVAEGAEGCGLLRSEFLFQDRAAAPTEDEQLAEYQAIADELGGRPLIIRTLDVGGDKPLAYLSLPKEENPFLGLRGVRVGLAQPDMLRTQIRAILRVKPYGVTRIMVPMVASVSEMVAVRAMVEQERQAIGRSEPIEVGAMIEIPAAAVAARQLAEVCDFFSVGTNDLTQYALAMDRGNPAVAAGVDALHPGVLGLIRIACEGAAARGRMVAVCGGAASDPLAAPILVGLGVTELSAAPAAIPEIKATISALSFAQCKALADKALLADGPDAVRALALTA